MFQARLLDAAIKELAALDRPLGRRIARRIQWLAAHIETIHPELA